jgi:hypothetical protein
MPGIFISYRRDDSAGHTGRIYDRLATQFGPAQVFMDVDAIQPGEDFTRVLAERTKSCSALVAIIGRQWLSAQDRDGHRRLDDLGDYVRLEILSALTRRIVIIPVLVEGASLPRADELPAPLRKLSDHQALTVSDERFHAEIDELIRVLKLITARDAGGAWLNALRSRRAALIAGASIAALAAAGWWSTRGPRHADAPSASALLPGRWHANVIDPGSKFRVGFQFEVSADRLLGTVDYPTGTGAIRDGVIRGQHVSFTTTHLPQFAEGEATTRFEGDLSAKGLELVMQTDQMVRRIIAVKD